MEMMEAVRAKRKASLIVAPGRCARGARQQIDAGAFADLRISSQIHHLYHV